MIPVQFILGEDDLCASFSNGSSMYYWIRSRNCNGLEVNTTEMEGHLTTGLNSFVAIYAPIAVNEDFELNRPSVDHPQLV